MLNKNVDDLIIGKSYLSFILGQIRLGQNRSTLILDDSRIQYGNIFVNKIGEIEKNFLIRWGEEKDIAPLKELDKYLKISPYTVIVDKKSIRLGDTYIRNVTELARKCPFILPDTEKFIDKYLASDKKKKEIEKAVERYFQQLSSSLFSVKMSLPLFLKDLPVFVEEVFYFHLRVSAFICGSFSS